MSLADAGHVLRRWWWLIVLGLALGSAAGWGLTEIQSPVYRAKATVLVVQSQDGTVTLQDIQASQSLTATYAALVTARENLDRAVAALPELNLSAEKLEGRVSATATRETQLVEIAVEDTDKERAAQIANAVANALPEYINEIRTDSSGQQVTLNPVLVARRAVAPSAPVRPSPPLNITLGALAGTFLAIGLAVLKTRFDDRIRTRADLADLQLPLAGVIQHANRPKGSRRKRWLPATINQDPRSPFAESCRQVHAALAFSLAATDARVVVVTSALPGDGKTLTAVNLAQAFAETGKRVLLIDGDLRKPNVHERIGVPNAGGVTTAFLTDPAGVHTLVVEASEALYVLTAGPEPPNPAQVIASPRVGEIVSVLRPLFDLIIIDTAPLLGFADSTLWLPYSDGVLLVTRANQTRLHHLDDAVDAIRATNVPLLGVVLNDSSASVGLTGGYYTRLPA